MIKIDNNLTNWSSMIVSIDDLNAFDITDSLNSWKLSQGD